MGSTEIVLSDAVANLAHVAGMLDTLAEMCSALEGHEGLIAGRRIIELALPDQINEIKRISLTLQGCINRES